MVSGRNGDYSASPIREPDILVILVQENPSDVNQLPTYLIRLAQAGATSFTRIIPFSRLRQMVSPLVYRNVSHLAPGKKDKTEPIFECGSAGSTLRRLHFEENPEYYDLEMPGVLYRVARRAAEEKQRQFGPSTGLEDRTYFARTLTPTG